MSPIWPDPPAESSQFPPPPNRIRDTHTPPTPHPTPPMRDSFRLAERTGHSEATISILTADTPTRLGMSLLDLDIEIMRVLNFRQTERHSRGLGLLRNLDYEIRLSGVRRTRHHVKIRISCGTSRYVSLHACTIVISGNWKNYGRDSGGRYASAVRGEARVPFCFETCRFAGERRRQAIPYISDMGKRAELSARRRRSIAPLSGTWGYLASRAETRLAPRTTIPIATNGMIMWLGTSGQPSVTIRTGDGAFDSCCITHARPSGSIWLVVFCIY